MNSDILLLLAIVFGVVVLLVGLGRHWWVNVRPTRIHLEPTHYVPPSVMVEAVPKWRKFERRHATQERLAKYLHDRKMFGTLRRARTEAKKMLQGQL